MNANNHGNFLYWYRKVDRHPTEQAMAEAFCAQAVAWLSICAPALFWYKAAPAEEASKAFSVDLSKKESPGADPLRQSCAYFRWSGPPGLGPRVGYSHRESPLGIMIDVCRLGNELLETIAHECFYLHQDKVHPAGWRANTGDTVEVEACAFVREKRDEIRAFFQDWNNNKRGQRQPGH
jgi:hypothetical protein